MRGASRCARQTSDDRARVERDRERPSQHRARQMLYPLTVFPYEVCFPVRCVCIITTLWVCGVFLRARKKIV